MVQGLLPLAEANHRPPDKDSNCQKELWALTATRRPPSPRCKPQRRQPPPFERFTVDALLDARSASLRAFEEKQAQRRLEGSVGKAVNSGERESAPPTEHSTWEQPIRPPEGSAYMYPSCSWPKSTLSEHFQKSNRRWLANLEEDETLGVQDEYASRQERIDALDKALWKHDEDKLRRLAKGTAPMPDLDNEGRPFPPPVPPADWKDWKWRLKDARAEAAGENNRDYGQAPRSAREVLAREDILGTESKLKAHLSARATLGASDSGDAKEQAAAARRADVQGLKSLKGYKELLSEAEGFSADPNSRAPEYWTLLASQLCSHAYEAAEPDVLRMVRTVGAAARSLFEERAKKELSELAEHLLGSLSSRLRDTSIDFLTEVAEAMTDARVGSQIYLDALMAHILARHHTDCQCLTMPRATRLASALSRLAQILRLRPKGTGGQSTATNLRVMEALQKRLAERAAQADAEQIACLDGYFLVRLCSPEARKSILIRFAELEVGFRSQSTQYLPLALEMQDFLQRELGDAYRFLLPATARSYFERLQDTAAGKRAPWSLQGDTTPAATSGAPASSSLLEQLRAKYSARD